MNIIPSPKTFFKIAFVILFILYTAAAIGGIVVIRFLTPSMTTPQN